MDERYENRYQRDSSSSSSSTEGGEGNEVEENDYYSDSGSSEDVPQKNNPVLSRRKRKLGDELTIEETISLRRDHGIGAVLPKQSTRSRHEENEANRISLKLAKERLEQQSLSKHELHSQISQHKKGVEAIASSQGSGESTVKEKEKGAGLNRMKKKKKGKHAPTEASSKKSDFFARGKHLGGSGLNSEAMGIQHLYQARDPRMSDRVISKSSIYKADRDYAFLQEKVDDEIKGLKERIKAWNTTGSKGQRARRKLGMNATDVSVCLSEDKEKLQRLTQQRAERMRAQAKRQAHYEWKQKAASREAEGKSVYYPKRREIKQQLMEARFDELRKQGGDKAVEKAMAKRRKKNAQKDRRRVPNFGDSRTAAPLSRRHDF